MSEQYLSTIVLNFKKFNILNMKRRICKNERGTIQIVITIGIIAAIILISLGIALIHDSVFATPHDKETLNSAKISIDMNTDIELTVTVNVKNAEMIGANIELYFAIVDNTTYIPENTNDLIHLIEVSKYRMITSKKQINTPTVVLYSYNYSKVIPDFGSTWSAISVVKLTYRTSWIFGEEALRLEPSKIFDYDSGLFPRG